MDIMCKCQICGRKYHKKNGKSKYCSEACKKEAAREIQARWRREHPGYLKEWRRTHGTSKPGLYDLEGDDGCKDQVEVERT